MECDVNPSARLRTVEDRLGIVDRERQRGVAKDEGRDLVAVNRDTCELRVIVVAENGDLGGEGSYDLGPRFAREGIQACHQGVEFGLITFGIGG